MSIVLDTESIVLEALDFDTPCEGMLNNEPCPHPAAWSYLWSCGCVTPYCQVHHDMAQQHPAEDWECALCEQDISIISITPMRGRL
ncbi:hypothetical protein SEA_JEHOSHAPHAT_8 [Microbacterium phage Jehoshaphat]|nr:hypothetical protein SEA_TEEHEE_8 [Microbacterium phage Teehee]QXN73401.1 hypothetical protein SEA_JEHOSHAPHAT_8 [Microbacterium phage Jehoshaphat]